MAEHLAGTAAMDSIGGALNKFYYDNYKLGLDTMGSAIDRNPNVMASALTPASVTSAVGQQQRQMEQAQLDQAYNQWLIDQQLPFMRATDIMSLVQGMPGATSVTQMQGLSPQGGMGMGGMLGMMGMQMLPMLLGGMGGAGAAGGLGSLLGFLPFLSDEKAKTNIQAADPEKALEEITSLDPITYEYTPEALAMGAPSGTRTGFTAQALEAATGKELPTINGFKAVDAADMIGKLALALMGLNAKVDALAEV
jgi:hypothetical protein